MVKDNEAAYDLNERAFELKVGLGEMIVGGIIAEVRSSQEAKIAQEAGAVAVVVGGNSRMCEISEIKIIQDAVSIPVMVKCSKGHTVEAEILESMFVDFIDESEDLVVADSENDIDKKSFKIPFVCGCRDFAEALIQVAQGASLLRTRSLTEGESSCVAGTIAILRAIDAAIRQLPALDKSTLASFARKVNAPLELILVVAQKRRLPVPLIAYGAIVQPADVAFCMQLGADGVCIDNAVFRESRPEAAVRAAVLAAACCHDPTKLAQIACGKFPDITPSEDDKQRLFSQRGW